MTTENVTALIWMLPVALTINALGFYAVVKLAITGKSLIERKQTDEEREPMRGIHDARWQR